MMKRLRLPGVVFPNAFVCILGAATTAGQVVPPGYEVETLTTVFGLPTAMEFIDENSFLVASKHGSVSRVDLRTPGFTTHILSLPVDQFGERGLLGMAVHPNFSQNQRVYFYYTNAAPLENRIEYYVWNGASLVNGETVATLPADSALHNGGIILFGPDGKLYAVIGDQGRSEMTENVNNEIVSDTAVILRLNDDGSIPADNPFNQSGWEKYYAYGVRNSFGLAFDRLTDRLWMTENGGIDEVNQVISGMNSGWKVVTGPIDRSPFDVSDLVMINGATYKDPVFSWLVAVAPTSILFLDSCRWPHAVRHDCFVGDANTGNLYRFEPNPTRTEFALTGGLADNVADPSDDQQAIIWGTGFEIITDIEIGPDGYLYIVETDLSSPGAVRRVRPVNPMGDINQDGNVTFDDASLFTAVLLGQSTDAQQLALSDFDGDGLATGSDIPCFIESLRLTNN